MTFALFCILILAGWLIPDHFPPWMAFHNEAPAFLAALVLAWHSRLDRKALTTTTLTSSATWPLLAVLALVWAQWALGLLPFLGDASTATVYLLAFGLVWRVGAQLGRNAEDTRQRWVHALAATFAAGAVLSTWMAWLQWFGLEETMAPWVMSAAHTHRALGNLGQPNQLATLMLMGTVGLAILYESRRLSGWLAALLVVLVTTGVVLTQSRTALVSATCLVLLFLLARNATTGARIKGLALWGWLGSLLGMTALFQHVLLAMSPKAPAGAEIMSIGLRPVLWKQLLTGLAESPWWGYGWLQTAAAQQQGARLVPGLEQANYSHNLLLDLMVWCGVPVAILLVIWMTRWLITRWLRVREMQGVLLFAWLAPLAVHSMLEFPFAYAYLLIPAGLILGLIDGEQPENSRVLKAQWDRALGSSMLLVYTLLVPALGWEYVKVEEDFRVARFENMRVGQTPPDYATPDLRLLTQWRTVLDAMRLRAEPGMSDQEIRKLEQASLRFSWGALHFRYALALGLNGYPEEASAQMELISKLYKAEMYDEARKSFLMLQKEKYPQLSLVRLP